MISQAKEGINMTVQNRIKAIRLANRLENDKKMKEIIAVKIVDKKKNEKN